MKQLFLIPCLLFISLLSFSQSNYEKGSKVRVHSLGDVEHLNFATATDYQSTILSFLSHQFLYNLDPITYEYVPVLAKERAKQYTKDGKLHLDFEIREEAMWDDGTVITGHDVVFSLKIIFCPNIENAGRLMPYLDYIEDIIVNAKNPKKFTVVCNKTYMSAETSIAHNLLIIPSSTYAPDDILSKYPIKTFIDDGNYRERIINDGDLQEFGDFFSSDIFKTEIINGSGPYKFVEWKINESILFQRKENWWGDQVKEKDHPWFQAYPEFIEYVTINYLNTAMVAITNGKIDAIQGAPNQQFVTLQKENPEQLHYFTPPLFSYDYIGLNTQNPILSDIQFRKALSHLMDVDKLIATELYGLGSRTSTMVHPEFSQRVSPNIKMPEMSLSNASKILQEAGWDDMDGNGILEKVTDGETIEAKLTIISNNGNNRRKAAAEILKEAAEKVGIQIEIKIIEWSAFLDRVRKKDFDMYILGWAASPVESDPAQIWHTDAYDGGSNYVGFGTPKSDVIIDQLRETSVYEDRIPLYHQLQEIIQREIPYIFLVHQKNRVIISKKFKNAYGTGLQSGLMPQHLKLAK